MLLMVLMLLSCGSKEIKNGGRSTATKWKYGEFETITGYIDLKGSWVIEPDEKYEDFGDFENGIAKGYQEKKYIDKTGKFFLLEPDVNKRLVEVKSKLKEKGLWMSMYKKDMENDDYFPVEKPAELDENGRGIFQNGVMDKNFNLLTELKYKIEGRFNCGLAPAMEKVGDEYLLGYINTKGETVIKPEYNGDIPQPFMDNCLAKVSKKIDGKQYYGLIDKTGKVILPLEYSSVGEFSEGLAGACKGDSFVELCGYIDESGKFLTKIIFNRAYDFKDGIAVFEIFGTKKQGIMNRNFQAVIKPQYDRIFVASKNIFAVLVGQNCQTSEEACGLWGYINEKEEWLIEPKYDTVRPFSEGLAAASLFVKSTTEETDKGMRITTMEWKTFSGKMKKVVKTENEMGFKINKKIYIDNILSEEYDGIIDEKAHESWWDMENKITPK